MTQNATKAVRRWLILLGTLTSGRRTEAEAGAVVDAMTPMLAAAFPPEAFTQASLHAVASASPYFPAYATLCSALRAHLEALLTPVQALPPPPSPAMTEETEAAIDREWWSDRVADCASIQDATARWRRAAGMHAVLVRPGAFQRPGVIAALAAIMAAAEEDGAETEPAMLQPAATPRSRPALNRVPPAPGAPPSGAAAPDEPRPVRVVHLSGEALARFRARGAAPP